METTILFFMDDIIHNLKHMHNITLSNDELHLWTCIVSECMKVPKEERSDIIVQAISYELKHTYNIDLNDRDFRNWKRNINNVIIPPTAYRLAVMDRKLKSLTQSINAIEVKHNRFIRLYFFNYHTLLFMCLVLLFIFEFSSLSTR